jgi:hypothetical protein
MLAATGALMGAGAVAGGAGVASAAAGAAPVGSATAAAGPAAAAQALRASQPARGAVAQARRSAVARRPARGAACRTTTVSVTAGRSAKLTLNCAIRRGGRLRWAVRGRTRGATRALVGRPAHGRMVRLDRRAGTVRYVPARGFAGSDRIRFTVTVGGRIHRGAIVVRVRRRAAAPGTPPAPAPPAPSDPATPPLTEPPGDGLPAQLPPAQPSYASASWTPSPQDTCPATVHERYSVIGPDGKRYPTWHPPTTVDPATGRTCTFGHEHGRDPRGSDIAGWVAEHLAAPGAEAYAGIPFGLATESLDVYAAANPGTRIRHEDNVGYKVDYENDVRLLAADGRALGVTCDYLVSVHQGSHSPDALSNNVHELLYAVRCDDGTELISDTISRFGAPGEYVRSCDPARTVATTDNGYPAGAGRREIPDRACVESTVLVPAGRTTSAWALYEKWSAGNELRTADGRALASFDPAFGVFNPSRYANAAGARGIGRTVDLCWEGAPDGSRFRGAACTAATEGGAIGAAYGFDDVRSPFDGTRRDVYLRETTLRNAGGQRLYWTDPYGGNASTTPFAGALCQLVGTVDTSARPALQERVFGRNRSNDDMGVHAPN